MKNNLLNREKLIETIKKMPEHVSIDDVFDRIILLNKIETGLEQSEKGHITPDDMLDEKLPEWLK